MISRIERTQNYNLWIDYQFQKELDAIQMKINNQYYHHINHNSNIS